MQNKLSARVRFQNGTTSSAVLCTGETYEDVLKQVQTYVERQKTELEKPGLKIIADWNGDNVVNLLSHNLLARYKNKSTRLICTIVIDDSKQDRVYEPSYYVQNAYSELDSKVAYRMRPMIRQLMKQFGYSEPEAIGTVARSLQLLTDEVNGKEPFFTINLKS